jgi:hypothetical protein
MNGGSDMFNPSLAMAVLFGLVGVVVVVLAAFSAAAGWMYRVIEQDVFEENMRLEDQLGARRD